jgi:uncharacterized membrane protein YhdT
MDSAWVVCSLTYENAVSTAEVELWFIILSLLIIIIIIIIIINETFRPHGLHNCE